MQRPGNGPVLENGAIHLDKFTILDYLNPIVPV
jgi:hypothetical protein